VEEKEVYKVHVYLLKSKFCEGHQKVLRSFYFGVLFIVYLCVGKPTFRCVLRSSRSPLRGPEIHEKTEVFCAPEMLSISLGATTSLHILRN
jgi:hypothetical protein